MGPAREEWPNVKIQLGLWAADRDRSSATRNCFPLQSSACTQEFTERAPHCNFRREKALCPVFTRMRSSNFLGEVRRVPVETGLQPSTKAASLRWRYVPNPSQTTTGDGRQGPRNKFFNPWNT